MKNEKIYKIQLPLLRKLVVTQNLVGEGRCPFTLTPELLIPPSLMAFTWNYRYSQQFLRK